VPQQNFECGILNVDAVQLSQLCCAHDAHQRQGMDECHDEKNRRDNETHGMTSMGEAYVVCDEARAAMTCEVINPGL
jgi:hypothetical protein